jgi:hypothetical protein
MKDRLRARSQRHRYHRLRDPIGSAVAECRLHRPAVSDGQQPNLRV